MSRTIGYHVVKTGYGLWLPGDHRGSWSESWDEQIGYTEPHTLHAGDPQRERMAAERMRHDPVRFTPAMVQAVANALADCIQRSGGGFSIAAMSIEPTHLHLLIPYTGRDIDGTTQWIADQSTKAVHRETDHAGPVWAKGKWRTYIFEDQYWRTAAAYIRRHNTRRGLPPDPHPFITPL